MSEADRDTLVRNLSALLRQLGSEGACRGCGKRIWWCKTKAGKNAPITEDGLNHFADCTAADQFRGGDR